MKSVCEIVGYLIWIEGFWVITCTVFFKMSFMLMIYFYQNVEQQIRNIIAANVRKILIVQ